MDWPLRQCVDMWGEFSDGSILRARAESMLAHGLALHSDFSGQLCAESGIRAQLRGMKLYGAPVAEDGLLSYSACERSETYRGLIKSARHPPLHLFSDVLHHLPGDLREKVISLRPPKREKCSTPYQRQKALSLASEAHRAQSQLIHEHAPTAFPHDRAAHCEMHDDCCPMLWSPANDMPRHEQPLSWNVSGPMCDPYSRMGSRTKSAHPSVESWHAWSESIAVGPHDLVTCENSDMMPLAEFSNKMSARGPLGAKWFMVPLILSTQDSSYRGYLCVLVKCPCVSFL
jgi:hypothetical protein